MGAGLAVPDWPTSFGYNMFLFPWSKMIGGIFYEHMHRLLGSVVGILTVCTAVIIFLTDTRKWLKYLSLLACALVIFQGILGGLRVVLIELDLAIVHACVAQLFFALMVSMTLFTSKGWLVNKNSNQNDSKLNILAILTVCSIYIQTILGALLRHTGNMLEAHFLFAFIVGSLIIWLCVRANRVHYDNKEILRNANWLGFILCSQILLGLFAFIQKYTILGKKFAYSTFLISTSLHVVFGALLLAFAITLTLRILRFPFKDSTIIRSDSIEMSV
tara:strand:+ start:920 stop:1741 length:822 start_codon:yes stop_codon:yes gene_type:complete